MARNCCICGQKISASSARASLPTDSSLIMCFTCYAQNRALSTKDCSPEKIFAAREYFQHFLDNASMSDTAEEYVKGLISNIPEEEEPTDPLEEYKASTLMTSGYDFQGYKITGYLGIISGEVVLGTGFLSEFKSGFSDFFGVESNAFAEKLETAKVAAVEKLQRKAYQLKANALIGLDFDYITFAGNMIGISANATAVTVEKLPDGKEHQEED